MDEPKFVLRETWLSRKPHATALVATLFSTLLLVLGAVTYWQNWGGLASLMPASHQAIWDHHEIWRAWSTLLAHVDEKHLLSNTFLYFILGYFLNGYFGFLIFPGLAFVFGGIINLVLLKSAGPEMQVIGASGVVFWMGGAWLSLYLGLERKKTFSQRLLRAVGVGLALFMPAEAFDPAISYQSHGIGFLLGVLFGLFYFVFRRSYFRSAEVYELVADHENLTCPDFGRNTICPVSPKIDS